MTPDDTVSREALWSAATWRRFSTSTARIDFQKSAEQSDLEVRDRRQSREGSGELKWEVSEFQSRKWDFRDRR
jgi:hypothetical protein